MAGSSPLLADRAEAGRRLADRLERLRGEAPTVLALPRGGVPVAAEIAGRLGVPLDVFVVRKIAAPGEPEYALGAVAEGAPPWLDLERVRALGLAPGDLAAEIDRERVEVDRRVLKYRGGRPAPPVEGRTVIVVDDGLATGATALVAVRAVRARRPRRLLLAVGVASFEAHALLAREVDELVCLSVPRPFFAVGNFFRDFPQVSDAQMRALLERHRPPSPPPAAPAGPAAGSG